MNREERRLDLIANHYQATGGRIGARLISHYAFKTVCQDIQGPAVLMMGLGDGLIAEYLAHYFKNVTVVEGSKIVIDNFNGDGLKIVNSLFEEYEPAHRFDTVLGTYVLEHIDDPVKVLYRVRSWLKKNGRAIFAVPNADSLHRRIGVELGILKRRDAFSQLDIEIGHRRVYSIHKLREHLSAAGFEVLKFKGFLLKVLSNEQMADWPRDLLDALYRVSLQLPPQYCSSIAAICWEDQ